MTRQCDDGVSTWGIGRGMDDWAGPDLDWVVEGQSVMTAVMS